MSSLSLSQPASFNHIGLPHSLFLFQEPENPIYHPIYFTFNEEKPTSLSVRAVFDYTAMRSDELTYSHGAVITNVERHEGGWWCGDHGKMTRGWFPANYVEEIKDESENEERELGNLQQGSISIAGCSAEIIGPYSGQKMCVMRIYPRNEPANIGQPALEVAANTLQELQSWKEVLEEANKIASTMVSAELYLCTNNHSLSLASST